MASKVMLKPSNAALKIRGDDKFRFNEEVSVSKSKSQIKSPVISLKTKQDLDLMSRASKMTLQSLNKKGGNTKSLKSVGTNSFISRASKLSRTKSNNKKVL